MDQPQQLLKIIEVLTAGKVRYVMIDGVAMRLHGSSHVTDNVDVCYGRDPVNLQALAGALAPYHPTLRGAPAGLPFVLDARSLKASLNFTLDTDIGQLDILGEPPGVSSSDDLIAMKRAAGRLKDQSHILELEALRKLVQEEDAGG